MADKLALQEIVAEYSVKDLATKSVKSIDKEIEKSVKSTKQFEAELKKSETALGRMAKAAKGTGAGVAGVTGTVVQKPIGTAESVISSGVGGALMAIPVVGGLLSAFMGSVGDISDKFTAGVILQKSLNKDLSTIDRTFKKTGIDLLGGMDKTFSTVTEQRATFAKLAGAGVEATTLKAGGASLELLAKAQGVDLKDVLSTRLETGKGLSKAEISLIEAYKPLLGNIYTADIAYKLITQTVDKAKDRLTEAASANKNLTSGLQATSVNIDTQKQSLALMAVSEKNFAKSLDAFSLEIDKQRANFFVKSKAAGFTTIVTGAIRGETDTRFQDWQASGSPGTFSDYRKAHPRPGDAGIPKRANGGDVKKGHTYQINENEQEYFTPGQNGRINTSKQMASGGAVSFAPVINIYGDVSGNIRQEVEMALNNVAKKIAYNQGMKIPG